MLATSVEHLFHAGSAQPDDRSECCFVRSPSQIWPRTLALAMPARTPAPNSEPLLSGDPVAQGARYVHSAEVRVALNHEQPATIGHFSNTGRGQTRRLTRARLFRPDDASRQLCLHLVAATACGGSRVGQLAGGAGGEGVGEDMIDRSVSHPTEVSTLSVSRCRTAPPGPGTPSVRPRSGHTGRPRPEGLIDLEGQLGQIVQRPARGLASTWRKASHRTSLMPNTAQAVAAR